jgi:hypothetical protein
MTMPTSDLWNRTEVRFPADFTALYATPLHYFGGAYYGGSGGNPEGLEWPPNDGFANDNDIFHKQKALEAVQRVADMIRTRQVQRMNQMTHQPGTAVRNTAAEAAYIDGDAGMAGSGFFGDIVGTLFGSKTAPLLKKAAPLLRFVPGVGQYAAPLTMAADVIDRTFNKQEGSGRFSYSPGTGTIEGAPVLSGRARPMRGGVMRTQAGLQHIRARLAARVGELDGIDAAAAQQPPPAPPQGEQLEGADEVEAIGEYLDILDDNFTSGAIDTEALAAARGLYKNVTKIGFRIPQNLITPILRQVDEMLSIIEAVANTPQSRNATQFKPAGDRAKRLRTIFQILERVRTALTELSRVSDRSPQERMMALQSLQAPLQEEVRSQRVRKPRDVPRPVPLPRGQTGQIYPYRTQAERRA